MLRIRLVLWYAFLVVMTVAAVGAIQYILLYRSLTNELDTALLDDARATLRLVETRTTQQLATSSTTPKTNVPRSLKDIIDEALAQTPDTIKGDELTDRVLSYLMNEMLNQLSAQDSSAANPFDLIVERTLTSKRNNMVEILAKAPDSSGKLPVIFRTKNLSSQSLYNVYKNHFSIERDTAVTLGSSIFNDDEVRGAYVGSKQFGVIVSFSTNYIDDTVSGLLRTYLFLLPIALVIASLGGLVLSRKALKPFEEIAETAQDISAKNLSQRISMPARQDRELRLLVSTLNSMFGRLESSFERIAQFSSDASHELKTPLAILRGEIEQMQRKIAASQTIDRAAAESMLSSMTEEVARMQRIVEGLLLLAKADDHRLTLELETFDLAEFLRSIAEDAEILTIDRELTFHSKIVSDQAIIRADKTKLYQVIMNLFDNALKYTPKGGEVTMFLERSGKEVRFGVSDSGKGIALEDQDKIFQRFYRTEEARSHRGAEYVARSLGLGLAIVKSIIDLHQGQIEVESEPGKGSKFIITLPLV
ncbi:MAG TPA: ATP-binding protein [Candidatus Kapabacteria bacterium]|nr:ATP-binding protein [Candidatus Kapabacteria bacterium]